MASQSMVLFLVFCLVSSLSLGLAERSSISPMPSKEGALECWAAAFDLSKCVGELYRASQGRPLELSIWPDCCKAAKSISAGCWPKVFPLYPMFPQLLKLYCPLFAVPPPPPLMTTNVEGSFVASNLVATPTLDADGQQTAP
ncbi:uncharacterized protein LOC143566364 [Bidens hawaiensis]|uniref:uncharacterized protein LOC143566364 n=1 Tax=Bidens hawaiensis TaxID=980011 RepID=UPI00404B03D6